MVTAAFISISAARSYTDMVAFISETDARVLLGLFIGVPATVSATAAVYAAKANRKLKRNGGSTPADAIDRIEVAVKDLSSRMSAVEDYITNPKENQ